MRQMGKASCSRTKAERTKCVTDGPGYFWPSKSCPNNILPSCAEDWKTTLRFKWRGTHNGFSWSNVNGPPPLSVNLFWFRPASNKNCPLSGKIISISCEMKRGMKISCIPTVKIVLYINCFFVSLWKNACSSSPSVLERASCYRHSCRCVMKTYQEQKHDSILEGKWAFFLFYGNSSLNFQQVLSMY